MNWKLKLSRSQSLNHDEYKTHYADWLWDFNETKKKRFDETWELIEVRVGRLFIWDYGYVYFRDLLRTFQWPFFKSFWIAEFSKKYFLNGFQRCESHDIKFKNYL